MAGVLKLFCFVTLIVIAGVQSAGGACNPDATAIKLQPCLKAARNAKAPVPTACCSRIKAFRRDPKCLCDVLFSKAAKRAHINPRIASTLPKRCHVRLRPYNCQRHSAP